MTDLRDDPLVHRLQEALCVAQARYRSRRGWGAVTTPRIPNPVIDEVAAALAPVIRQAARDAAHELQQTQHVGERR